MTFGPGTVSSNSLHTVISLHRTSTLSTGHRIMLPLHQMHLTSHSKLHFIIEWWSLRNSNQKCYYFSFFQYSPIGTKGFSANFRLDLVIKFSLWAGSKSALNCTQSNWSSSYFCAPTVASILGTILWTIGVASFTRLNADILFSYLSNLTFQMSLAIRHTPYAIRRQQSPQCLVSIKRYWILLLYWMHNSRLFVHVWFFRQSSLEARWNQPGRWCCNECNCFLFQDNVYSNRLYFSNDRHSRKR